MLKKIVKIGCGALVLLVAVAGAVLGPKVYRNTHFWEKELENLQALGVEEKQAALPGGHVINYGEIGEGPALLLIHGQTGQWEDYATVMQDLAKDWHVYAVDVYGHGQSSHDEACYYIDTNGDDFIWFIEHIIGAPAVVSGHSNGALLAAYVAAYGGEWVRAAVLEDPPVFSTQGEGWEESFAYLDTYAPMHDYLHSVQEECWPAYYLRHCYWGQTYMANAMPGIANYAQKYHERHPNEAVKIFFLPEGINRTFAYTEDYDMRYGEHFYDLTWHHGHRQEDILAAIEVPCTYIHAKENLSDTGVYFCAASREQAERAVGYIGENAALVETENSDHNIHGVHKDFYLEVINSYLPGQGENNV